MGEATQDVHTIGPGEPGVLRPVLDSHPELLHGKVDTSSVYIGNTPSKAAIPVIDDSLIPDIGVVPAIFITYWRGIDCTAQQPENPKKENEPIHAPRVQ